MIRLMRHAGPCHKVGWTCCDGVGPECDEPAHNLVIDDGRWHYQAACDNEQHMAEAIRLHLEYRDENPTTSVSVEALS